MWTAPSNPSDINLRPDGDISRAHVHSITISLSHTFCCNDRSVTVAQRREHPLVFLVLHFLELCLGSTGFRAVGQRPSGPQGGTPAAGLAELGVWWLLTHSALRAACSVEPLATLQPRKISKRELALYTVAVGRKCKRGHLCKSNPPSSILNTLLPPSCQTFFPLLSPPGLQGEKCLGQVCAWPPFYQIWRFSMLGLFWTAKPLVLPVQGLGYETVPWTEKCKLQKKWQHTSYWNLSGGSMSPIAVALLPG